MKSTKAPTICKINVTVHKSIDSRVDYSPISIIDLIVRGPTPGHNPRVVLGFALQARTRQPYLSTWDTSTLDRQARHHGTAIKERKVRKTRYDTCEQIKNITWCRLWEQSY